MLPDHARFVIMIVLEWDHFKKCRSATRKEYVKGLKKGASIPHRETCIKILMVITLGSSHSFSDPKHSLNLFLGPKG